MDYQKYKMIWFECMLFSVRIKNSSILIFFRKNDYIVVGKMIKK